MADRSDAAEPTVGSVSYVDPDGLHNNPAFTNVVVVEGPVRTVYVGGQNAVDASGNIVGKGDIAAQTEQVLANLQAARNQVEPAPGGGGIPAGGVFRFSTRVARHAEAADDHRGLRRGVG